MAINTFYPHSPVGTASKLIFDAHNLNRRALQELVDKLSQQFYELTGERPVGQGEFCLLVEHGNERGSLALSEILSSPFFQSMQVRELPHYHELVMMKIASKVMSAAKGHFVGHRVVQADEKMLAEWYARFAECFIRVEDVVSYDAPLPATEDSIRRQVEEELRVEAGATAIEIDTVAGVYEIALQMCQLNGVGDPRRVFALMRSLLTRVVLFPIYTDSAHDALAHFIMRMNAQAAV